MTVDISVSTKETTLSLTHGDTESVGENVWQIPQKIYQWSKKKKEKKKVPP